jgi:hypothetical protein
MSISKIARIAPQSTAVFVCDIQEKFRGRIWQFPSVISVAGKMVSLGTKLMQSVTRQCQILKSIQKIKASRALDMPVYVTEQYPKGKVSHTCVPPKTPYVYPCYCPIGLGSTVSALDVSDAKVVLPKTKFSMYLPEIAQSLKETEIKSVILFGIEVRISNSMESKS